MPSKTQRSNEAGRDAVVIFRETKVEEQGYPLRFCSSLVLGPTSHITTMIMVVVEKEPMVVVAE